VSRTPARSPRATADWRRGSAAEGPPWRKPWGALRRSAAGARVRRPLPRPAGCFRTGERAIGASRQELRAKRRTPARAERGRRRIIAIHSTLQAAEERLLQPVISSPHASSSRPPPPSPPGLWLLDGHPRAAPPRSPATHSSARGFPSAARSARGLTRESPRRPFPTARRGTTPPRPTSGFAVFFHVSFTPRLRGVVSIDSSATLKPHAVALRAGSAGGGLGSGGEAQAGGARYHGGRRRHRAGTGGSEAGAGRARGDGPGRPGGHHRAGHVAGHRAAEAAVGVRRRLLELPGRGCRSPGRAVGGHGRVDPHRRQAPARPHVARCQCVSRRGPRRRHVGEPRGARAHRPPPGVRREPRPSPGPRPVGACRRRRGC
jgi:hypothetical protein